MPATVNSYEATFILGETATEDQAKAKTTELTKFIESLEGKVSKTESWGRRELAYDIKRNRTGFYISLWFELPAKEVAALERQLRFDESIIRSLVTIAYTSAQPGSLYPVAEEEKTSKPGRTPRHGDKEETATAEEELRRGTTKRSAAPAKEEIEDDEPEISEEERLKKLDESLDEMLKDEAK